MLDNDLLERTESRGFPRWTIIATAVVLGVCILSGVFAPAILSSHRPQQTVRSAEYEAEVSPTLSDPAATSAPPVIQSAPIIFQERFGQIPDQAEIYDQKFPQTYSSNQALLPNIPMPVARPNRHVVGPVRKSAKTVERNTDNKNNTAIRDGPIYQTEPAQGQSSTIVRESTTSESDARKNAAIELEQSYVNAGITVSTHVSGINGTVLNIDFPQFTDALVQKIMGVHSFAATLGKVGFTKIIFTGSPGKIWTFPLPPTSQPSTSTTAEQ